MLQSGDELLVQLDDMVTCFACEVDLAVKGNYLNQCQSQTKLIDTSFNHQTPFDQKKRFLALRQRFEKAHGEFVKQFEFEKIKMNILTLSTMKNQIRYHRQAESVAQSKIIIAELRTSIYKYDGDKLLDQQQAKFIYEAKNLVAQFEVNIDSFIDGSVLDRDVREPAKINSVLDEVPEQHIESMSYEQHVIDPRASRQRRSMQVHVSKPTFWSSMRDTLKNIFQPCSIRDLSPRHSLHKQ